MKRIHIIILLLIFMGLLATGCTNKGAIATSGQKKVKVFTTIYPLYDFANKIGGDKVEVINIVPPGSEPHEWEPTPRDVADISQADVLVYCGAGMESWIQKLLPSIDQTRVAVVDASKNIELIKFEQEDKNHVHESLDPHIWTDPLNAKQMVENILLGLCNADPGNKSFYQKRAAAYEKELDSLHNEYKTSLEGAKNKEFVVSHAAFGYLAHRYGIKQVPIRGLSPEVEPSPSDMAEIIKTAKDKGIRYIFTETMVSPKVSEALANEISAKVLVLNDMGGLTKEDIASGKDYLSIMRDNLKNLKLALGVSI